VFPNRVSGAEWPAHVNEMKGRAHLDDHEAELVSRFLVTMAGASVATAQLSPVDRAAARPGAVGPAPAVR